jgi:hypothetical protein
MHDEKSIADASFWSLTIPGSSKNTSCRVHPVLSDRHTYRRFLLIDLNLTPSAIAFCATAPRVRRSFFAV